MRRRTPNRGRTPETRSIHATFRLSPYRSWIYPPLFAWPVALASQQSVLLPMTSIIVTFFGASSTTKLVITRSSGSGAGAGSCGGAQARAVMMMGAGDGAEGATATLETVKSLSDKVTRYHAVPTQHGTWHGRLVVGVGDFLPVRRWSSGSRGSTAVWAPPVGVGVRLCTRCAWIPCLCLHVPQTPVSSCTTNVCLYGFQPSRCLRRQLSMLSTICLLNPNLKLSRITTIFDGNEARSPMYCH